MRSEPVIHRAICLACLAFLVVPMLAFGGDEPRGLGRLFRFGSASDSTKSSGATASAPGSSGSSVTTSAPYRSANDLYAPPALSTPPSTPTGTSTIAPAPRITPKSRSTKAITEADPLVTQTALGHGDGGTPFVMFLEVFADGTVIDSSGVHKISPDALKPVVDAVGSADFGKLKGHCGGPAGDTFETIHVVTYERAYGRLRANAFSYSGNPQGCDHAVHHLHKVLEDLQMKLITPAAPGGGTAATTPMVVAPATAPLSTSTLSPMPAPLPMSGSSGGLPMPSLPDPGLH